MDDEDPPRLEELVLIVEFVVERDNDERIVRLKERYAGIFSGQRSNCQITSQG